jgi:pimeloyl-ACP methyl ester carboxylesterase
MCRTGPEREGFRASFEPELRGATMAENTRRRSYLWSGAAALTAAVTIGVVPLTQSQAATTPVAATRTGWEGIVRETVRIPMEGGWVAGAELSYPRGARGKLPTVVLLHGSGKNDLDQTLPGPVSTFRPIAQTVNRQGFAVLRFNKRGVVGAGPELSDDPALLFPMKPYEQVLRDAAAAVRFAQKQKRVDPNRVFLLGHSEGTMVASNLAADPKRFGLVEPAGVVAMGVVGGTPRETLYYQAVGTQLGRLHEEFDFDGDGRLTATEATKGLAGQAEQIAQQLRPFLLDGTDVNPRFDTDGDRTLAIDAELEPVIRAGVGFDQYPHLPGAPKGLDTYLEDLARFPTPEQDLPRYTGPVLLLNGRTDIQTRPLGAITTDAALTKAGNRDHQLITYPGMGHLMNITPEYTPANGSPDQAVLTDISAWLAERR